MGFRIRKFENLKINQRLKPLFHEIEYYKNNIEIMFLRETCPSKTGRTPYYQVRSTYRVSAAKKSILEGVAVRKLVSMVTVSNTELLLNLIKFRESL